MNRALLSKRGEITETKKAKKAKKKSMKKHTSNTVDFNGAKTVVSSAQKFVIPIPAFENGGEPLVYPTWHDKAGSPILDYKGRTIGDRGIVFENPTDMVVQAAVGDGTKIIIVNQVGREQARRIEEMVRSLNPDPAQLTLEQVKDVLAWLYQSGMKDFYDSSVTFLEKSLTRVGAAPVGADGAEIPAFGLHKRDDKDTCYAYRVTGPCTVEGASAEPTTFLGEGIVLKHGDSFRAIQLEEFLETYTTPDGTALTADEIPIWE
jgi:hypothetical protein